MDPPETPFRYHLELTPEQLKITHTALRSLLDDFGHDEPEIVELIHQVLAKLPDEHAIRAIRIGERQRVTAVEVEADDSDDGDDGGSSAA